MHNWLTVLILVLFQWGATPLEDNLPTDKYHYQLSVQTGIWKNAGTESKGKEKKGNVLFNDALNTFYLRLYGVGHMVKDHSDSERGNPLPPHGLLFPINSKGSFICTIPQTG